jgi:NAD(P)-dependent dehydrogenase (short-subunit alcohol dehydrogenase family)
VSEITVSVVGSENPNWFDTHQIPKNAAYAIPDEAATRLMTASLDVTDPTAATRVVSDAVDHFGRIDVLVNNAGYGLITAFEEMSPEQIHQQFATNVYGVMNVTRAVLPVMRRQRSGHLFTIVSMRGYLGGSRGTAYAASKFAVAGFTESLALELEEFGITATIVGPGYFRTDFLDKSSAILEPATLIEDYRASNAAFRAATETANHAQQGDPNALGRLLVEIAAERKPPLHLPVGADAVQLVEQHHNSVLNDIKAWRAKSSNTAFKRRLVFVRRLYHVQDRWRTPGPATTV